MKLDPLIGYIGLGKELPWLGRQDILIHVSIHQRPS